MNDQSSFTIALAGNPNVGKSTIFNALTNLRQHTGNWSGKTVSCAFGQFIYRDARCHVVDLPGIYSLRTHSEEEKIAAEYITSGEADLLLVVCDATCLERGLHLLKQIADLKNALLPPVILCVNLCDEAGKKGIRLDFDLLRIRLNIPVIACTAREKTGLNELKEQVYTIYTNWNNNSRDDGGLLRAESTPAGQPCTCCQNHECPFHQIQEKSGSLHDFSPKELALQAVSYTKNDYRKAQETMDRIVTGRFTGSLIMIVLLLAIFWLTITGANYPSEFLWNHFYSFEAILASWLTSAGAPVWFIDASVYGVYRVVAWIVSVMLPPMAIFFPLFTLLEDLGYLPRVAFNMDCAFKRCNACGKQCLTMCIVIAACLNKSASTYQTCFF